MNGIDRLTEYGEFEFDKIVMYIHNGKIKCGKYASLIKLKKDFKVDKHELFNDGESTKE